LKNLTTEQFTGKLSVAGRDGLVVSAPREFALPPEGEITVAVNVTGRTSCVRSARFQRR